MIISTYRNVSSIQGVSRCRKLIGISGKPKGIWHVGHTSIHARLVLTRKSRLHTNCTALNGISDKHDVLLLSDHKRECLRLTIQAAAFLVGSIGNGGQATNAEYGEFTLCDRDGSIHSLSGRKSLFPYVHVNDLDRHAVQVEV